MKKILALALMLAASNAFGMNTGSIRTKVVCEEGYKFLIVWSSEGTSPTVVQIKEKMAGGQPPQPIWCEK